MSPPPIPPDRRTSRRGRSLMQGRICYGPEAAITLPCVIRNLSEGGAMLDVPADHVLPATFSLINITKATAWDVKLAWREGPRAGVVFLASHDLHNPTSDALRRLRRIWSTLAS